MPEIRLECIKKSYSSTQALDNLDLTVHNGEYLCLLGPTGAGKTTTLRIIAGLTTPDSGKIYFDDREVTHVEPEERKAVFLSQTYSLFPHMTVAENIVFGPNIRDWPDEVKKRTLAEMLDLVRLSRRADAYPRELSGGMQQRTALARALASGAEVLLLDEPLRALDARLRLGLRRELRSLAKSLGITTIHVTHDQEEALVMADRIAVIRKGKIAQIGTPEEVFDYPNSPFVANFVGQSNFFRGVVVSSNDVTLVKDKQGRTMPARHSHYKAGECVVIAVKVGNTEIVKSEDGYLTGAVERILFEGRNLFVDISIKGMGRCSSKIPAKFLDRIKVGDEVGIRWDAEKASIFSLEKCNLDEELKVE
ncbi:MAG: ABC transporter ATP-binding protein [Methanomassiliicoccales archaeon]|nr:ABC transporter ATP-binding protein [Methanomassiliicoccales archaeon]